MFKVEILKINLKLIKLRKINISFYLIEIKFLSKFLIVLFFSRFEAILNHGLKTDASSLSSLKEKVTNLVVTAPSANHVIKSPWPFIRLHLNRHELERYMLLKQVTTDLGRGKAWLRSSLNEHSLERYFHILISDKENLTQFYEGIN